MTREEAIEVYNGLINTKIKEAFEFFVPELREGEDERIRKWIYAYIMACPNDNFEFHAGVGKGRVLEWLEKQKENPKSADSIPSDCVSDVKYEDRWHKVGDSLPDNPREVLCKDEAGNYFIGRYYVGEGWEISNYDDEDKPHHLNPPVSKWIDFPSEKQKESLHISETCKENADSFTDENEKIKKALISLVEENAYTYKSFAGVELADMLSYLEQKEQKPPITGNDFGWIDELKHDLEHPEELDKKVKEALKQQPVDLRVKGDGVYKICPRCKERMVRDDSKVYTSMPPQYGYNCPKCGTMEFDTVMYDNPEVEERKAAEWDKNDTVFLKEIIDYFENKTVKLQHDIDMYAHWLKSLPERFNLQPKDEWGKPMINGEPISAENKSVDIPCTEWSEEDKHNLNSVINLVNATTDGAWGSCIGDRIENWLKNLPERLNLQPKQEWSEEDGMITEHELKVLKLVAEKDGTCLMGLYNKLKSFCPRQIYQAAKHDLAIRFMNYLDDNRPIGKMCLSNKECEDIYNAFKENDWAKILRYAKKYGK